MDGVKQPYLRPAQQGNAGIAASNIICVEGLYLIFKSYDGSPAFVNPDSVKRLEKRGCQHLFQYLRVLWNILLCVALMEKRMETNVQSHQIMLQ